MLPDDGSYRQVGCNSGVTTPGDVHAIVPTTLHGAASVGRLARPEPLSSSTVGCTIEAMASVVKRTISVPTDVFAAVEAEVTSTESLSTLFSEGARLLLRQRAGQRAIALYEAEHGPISQTALDDADRLLDEAGLR